MAQLSRPVADISNTGWTPTPVYVALNELVPDDASRVSTPNDPGNVAFEVQLAALVLPALGPCQLSVRLRETGLGGLAVRVLLLQGGTLITVQTLVPASAFTTYTFALTTAEIARITDFTALRLRVEVVANALCLAGDGNVVYLPAQVYQPTSAGLLCLGGDGNVMYIPAQVFMPTSIGQLSLAGDSNVAYVPAQVYMPTSIGQLCVAGDSNAAYIPAQIYAPTSTGQLCLAGDSNVSYTPGF